MKAKKSLFLIFAFSISCLMIWMSWASLIIGKHLYGKDATLLFAMGMVWFWGINGLINTFIEVRK